MAPAIKSERGRVAAYVDGGRIGHVCKGRRHVWDSERGKYAATIDPRTRNVYSMDGDMIGRIPTLMERALNAVATVLEAIGYILGFLFVLCAAGVVILIAIAVVLALPPLGVPGAIIVGAWIIAYSNADRRS